MYGTIVLSFISSLKWRTESHMFGKLPRQSSRGGHVIVSTFGPEGPTRCSSLDVVRYNAEALHNEFGAGFHLLESFKELHRTPFGAAQQFLYCLCKVE
jgi:hypothetical protein